MVRVFEMDHQRSECSGLFFIASIVIQRFYLLKLFAGVFEQF